MSNFLTTKIKNKEKYELNNRSEGGIGIGKDKEKEYGSITSLVNNEVSKIQEWCLKLKTLISLCVWNVMRMLITCKGLFWFMSMCQQLYFLLPIKLNNKFSDNAKAN